MKDEQLTLDDLVGARNLVEFCGVRPGDRVILLRSPTTDPVVAQAVEIAAQEAGGLCTHVEIPRTPRVFGLGERQIREYEVLSRAYASADIVIRIGAFGGQIFTGQLTGARQDYGVSYCMADVHSVEMLRSEYFRFPYRLTALIGEKIYRLLKGNKREIRVLSPSGTNYRCITDVDRYHVSGGQSSLICAKLRRPGDWSMFPSGNLGLCALAGEPTEGVFVADYLPPFTCPSAYDNPLLQGIQEPMTFHIKDHWVTDVTGAWADELLELWETDGDKWSRYDGGPMFGINPKAQPIGVGVLDPEAWYFPLHSSPMMYHQHIGFKWGVEGGSRISPVTTTPYCYKPTILVDGEPVIQDGVLTGRVLDDEVHEAAARYGDPKKVLAPVTHPYEQLFGWRYARAKEA